MQLLKINLLYKNTLSGFPWLKFKRIQNLRSVIGYPVSRKLRKVGENRLRKVKTVIANVIKKRLPNCKISANISFNAKTGHFAKIGEYGNHISPSPLANFLILIYHSSESNMHVSRLYCIICALINHVCNL